MEPKCSHFWFLRHDVIYFSVTTLAWRRNQKWNQNVQNISGCFRDKPEVQNRLWGMKAAGPVPRPAATFPAHLSIMKAVKAAGPVSRAQDLGSWHRFPIRYRLREAHRMHGTSLV
jgi:hypothetical protein